MDWNTILIIILVLCMLLCCVPMLFMMGKNGKGKGHAKKPDNPPQDRDTK